MNIYVTGKNSASYLRFWESNVAKYSIGAEEEQTEYT